MIKVKRALISVSEKKGILAFAKGLQALGVEILSTGGTARQLKEAGVVVQEVSDYTGFPEILDGRVKTLHPKIHGGLLALRDKPDHMRQLQEHGIGLIDMVVVNLYPFASVVQKKHVTLDEALENIDIGGPSMLRSAAKNFKSVAVVCNPARYEEILKELDTNSGLLSDAVLFQLAAEAFEHTADYDRRISAFLDRHRTAQEFSSLPRALSFQFSKIQDLRYGENPHQPGAFYKDAGEAKGVAGLRQIHGKELSFNNILDIDAAVSIVRDLEPPAAVIVKHGNPAGVAQDQSLSEAYRQAWQCDFLSAFGGIVGLNRKVDQATAERILKSGFMECVAAPAFQEAALKTLSQKKNLRLVTLEWENMPEEDFDFKKVCGGLLLQEKDRRELKPEDIKIVTRKKPSPKQMEALLFGWKVIKHVKSNAILVVKDQRSVGIGCGQTSRVEAVKIAVTKAGSKARGAVLVSDAFIPKVDNIQIAAKAGIKALIQTGGSVADEDVIRAADKAGLAMVMTGVRHFKH